MLEKYKTKTCSKFSALDEILNVTQNSCLKVYWSLTNLGNLKKVRVLVCRYSLHWQESPEFPCILKRNIGENQKITEKRMHAFWLV